MGLKMKREFAIFNVVLFLWVFWAVNVYGQVKGYADAETNKILKKEAVVDLPLKNFHQVDIGVYRSEQPGHNAFRMLEAFGIREILNLRSFHTDNKQAETTNLILHQVRMQAHNINDKEIIAALRIIKNRSGDILIHCQHGSDRTGVVCAMYHIVFQGWSKEKAINDLVNGGYGHHSIFKNIPNYIKRVDVDKIKKSVFD